jgi:altronate dehydratase small subunit
MSSRAFRIHPDDNVATLLDDAPAGPVAIIAEGKTLGHVTAQEPIQRGHKIALRALQQSEPVRKFGTRIGHCTTAIPEGAWVHLHNLASDLDERSAKLDLHTGVANDNASAYA